MWDHWKRVWEFPTLYAMVGDTGQSPGYALLLNLTAAICFSADFKPTADEELVKIEI